MTQPPSRKNPITIFSFSNLLVQLHVDSVIMHALMLFPRILGHQKSVTCFLAQVVEQKWVYEINAGTQQVSAKLVATILRANPRC